VVFVLNCFISQLQSLITLRVLDSSNFLQECESFRCSRTLLFDAEQNDGLCTELSRRLQIPIVSIK